MEYKHTKWAGEILERQGENGVWGNFHTLSAPERGRALSTEQALRRLYALGFRMEDEPIQKAVAFMSSCLRGESVMPDRREKLLDWDVFTELMLSAWIRRFTPLDDCANLVAKKWAGIVGAGFQTGAYRRQDSEEAYGRAYPNAPRGLRLVDFLTSFYQVSLLPGLLNEEAEALYFDYLLQNPGGVYYLGYSGRLLEPPEAFASKPASRYVFCMELLAKYERQRKKLGFAADWLIKNRAKDGTWDMGPEAKDGICFPLSDSWRDERVRRADCTHRLSALLDELGA